MTTIAIDEREGDAIAAGQADIEQGIGFGVAPGGQTYLLTVTLLPESSFGKLKTVQTRCSPSPLN